MDPNFLYRVKHKRIKVGSEEHAKFLQERYITCQCGYNNKKERIEKYGTCLKCKHIIDPKAYLRSALAIEYFKR